MFSILKRGLKKQGDIASVVYNGMCLNVLLDLANYYGIKSSNKKLTYNNVKEYLVDLKKIIKNYPTYSKLATSVRARILSSVIAKMRKKSFTFDDLCIAYFMIENGSPCIACKAEAFSKSIQERLGYSSIEKDRLHIKSKYSVESIAE